MVSLDDPVFYTQEEVFSIMESWGDVGRTYQLWFHFTWDLIFPILGFLFVALFISWLLQRGFRPESKAQKLNLLALGSVFDLLENICLVSLIVMYSDRPVAIAWLKTIFTMSKYSFGIPILLMILIGFVKAAMNKFKVQETMKTDS
jgi:FtsH-binding integral membrane protein